MNSRFEKTSHQSFRKRHAYTLVEMVLAIAIGSVVFGVCITGLTSLMRLDRKFSSESQQPTLPTRLVESLRSDGHLASSYSWDEEQQTLTYLFDAVGEKGSRQIQYEISNDRCLRKLLGDGSNKEDPVQTFRLNQRPQWEVRPPRGVAGDLVRIEVQVETIKSADESSEGAPSAAAIPPIAIACGRDSRLRPIVSGPIASGPATSEGAAP